MAAAIRVPETSGALMGPVPTPVTEACGFLLAGLLLAGMVWLLVNLWRG